MRSDLRMGYFYGDPLYMLEQTSPVHVNLWWARDDTAPAWHLAMAAQLQAARGAGIKNIVLTLNTTDPIELRFQLQRLSDGGYFNGWDSIVLYPLDEPEKFGLTDEDVKAKVTAIRQLGLDIPGLAFAKLGVFYGCETGQRPGIKAYDLVGCFRYESSGCSKLEGDYQSLRSQISTGSRLWLIPGGATIGAKDGKQEPACWASYAHRNSDVWGVVGFMWQSGADPRISIIGIRENGLRKLYCEMGRAILKPSETPRC